MKFIEDFKKFIFKGNVIDMAVGVVIGASFGKIVTGLVNYIINPFVGIFVKSGNLDSIKTVISKAVVDEAGNVVTPENAILWGTWIQTIIDFLLTALCIFIVLRILMKAKNTLERKKIEAEKKKAENRKMGSQPLFSRLGQAVLVSLSFFTSSKESPDSAEISSNESF